MNLPEILTQYLAAANRFDADAASECFTLDAHVHDEARDHVGREAIREWVAETSREYQPQVQVTDASLINADGASITANVSGSFPGSPAELHFDFILRDGRIAKLNIR